MANIDRLVFKVYNNYFGIDSEQNRKQYSSESLLEDYVCLLYGVDRNVSWNFEISYQGQTLSIPKIFEHFEIKLVDSDELKNLSFPENLNNKLFVRPEKCFQPEQGYTTLKDKNFPYFKTYLFAPRIEELNTNYGFNYNSNYLYEYKKKTSENNRITVAYTYIQFEIKCIKKFENIEVGETKKSNILKYFFRYLLSEFDLKPKFISKDNRTNEVSYEFSFYYNDIKINEERELYIEQVEVPKTSIIFDEKFDANNPLNGANNIFPDFKYFYNFKIYSPIKFKFFRVSVCNINDKFQFMTTRDTTKNQLDYIKYGNNNTIIGKNYAHHHFTYPERYAIKCDEIVRGSEYLKKFEYDEDSKKFKFVYKLIDKNKYITDIEDKIIFPFTFIFSRPYGPIINFYPNGGNPSTIRSDIFRYVRKILIKEFSKYDFDYTTKDIRETSSNYYLTGKDPSSKFVFDLFFSNETIEKVKNLNAFEITNPRGNLNDEISRILSNNNLNSNQSLYIRDFIDSITLDNYERKLRENKYFLVGDYLLDTNYEFYEFNNSTSVLFKFDTREYIKYHKVWRKINNPEIKKILYTEDGELKSKIEIKLDNTKNNILILK